jgi:hypothetical protein
VITDLYADPLQLALLLQDLKFAEADIDRMFSITALAALGSVEVGSAPIAVPPRRPSRLWYDVDDSPSWFDCPECDVTWQPSLKFGTTRPARPIHDCWLVATPF